MSDFNPYASQIDVTSTQAYSSGPLVAQKISIDVVELIQRSWALVREQYWLFLGIVLAGVLIGSAIPFQIIMGAMFCGIYLCYQERDQGRVVEFGQLFKGFDFFLESLFVTLMNMGLMSAFGCCGMLGWLVGFGLLGAAAGNVTEELLAGMMFGSMFVFGIPAFIILLLLSLPFLLAYPLVATRRLKAWEAVKAGFSAVWTNLFGMLWFVIATGFLQMVLGLMCFVPAVLFLPIYFGCIYLLCNDLFPREPEGFAV